VDAPTLILVNGKITAPDTPVSDIHWFIDHVETISTGHIDRVRALGGGIAVQLRMAYQGEDFAARYGQAMTAQSPRFR